MKHIKQISIGVLLMATLLVGANSFSLEFDAQASIQQDNKKDKNKKKSSKGKKKKSGSRTRTYTPPKKDK